jgi:hypothetical protein
VTTETLTTGTSWTCPTGVVTVIVECWGAGGAGGGNTTNTDGGGGGGGGAYSRLNAFPVVQNASYSYAIGQGGTPVSGGTGNPGGDTTWNSTSCVAKGGTGGASPSGGAGGLPGDGGQASAGTGDVEYNGGYGATGRDSSTGQGGHGGSSAGTAAAGYYTTDNQAFVRVYPSASTPTGGVDGGSGGTASNAGSIGLDGGGGGGGSGDTNAAALSGGTGGRGKIILTYERTPPQLTTAIIRT